MDLLLASDQEDKVLTIEENEILQCQNSRLVVEFQAKRLESDAARNWDKFYKRNENRFFKDRHWTTREFTELVQRSAGVVGQFGAILEVGCGVGNFLFPLIEENVPFFIFACDLSSRAINLLKRHPLYDEARIRAFRCDITSDFDIFQYVAEDSIDIATIIFALSSIHPDKYLLVLRVLWRILKLGGRILFRDYGLYDMAQFRFKAGHKIANNFYMRQDGTRVYYFSKAEVDELFTKVGFQIISNEYIHRRTINLKENVNVGRIFVQTVALKRL